MRIGVKLPTSGPFAGPEAIAAIAEAAEELGFDSLWVQDHITRSPEDAEHHFGMGQWEAWERPVRPDFYDAVTTLAYLAGVTKRVLLGTSALVLPLHNPVWIAKRFATIDQFADGRAILGVVAGGAYVRRELAAAGRPELAEPRGRVLDEYLDVIEGIWAEPKFEYEGEFISVAEAEIFPKPKRGRVPIWIGGFARKPRDRVARRGDAWLGIWRTPQQVREGAEEIATLAREYGRDPDQIRISAEGWLSIDEDGDLAVARAMRTRAGFSGYISNLPTASDDRVEGLSGNEDGYSMVGTPEAVAEKVAEYRDAGVDDLNLRVIATSLDHAISSLELFAREVMAGAEWHSAAVGAGP